MNSTLLGWVVVLLLVVGGGWYLYSGTTAPVPAGEEANAGSYQYTCDNGSTFTMVPASDVSSLTLSAGSQGMFSGTVTLRSSSSASAVFTGSVNGAAVSFAGDGETVRLTVGSETTTCRPVPDPENAPWNWGDTQSSTSAQGAGSVKQDTSLIVADNLTGKWQSTSDAKFVREFKAGDKVTDYYDGKAVTDGLWVVFTKANAPKIVPFPIDVNAVYVQITEKGTQQDTLNFKVQLSADANTLTLIYMDRGGATTYTRIQ